MLSKPWWQSKIILLNLASGVIETLQMLGGSGVVPQGTVTILVNAITIWLRIYKTSQPIE